MSSLVELIQDHAYRTMRSVAQRLPERPYVLLRHAVAHRKIPHPWRPREIWDYLLQRKLTVYRTDPLIFATADKHAVRQYVAERAGEQYLIPEYQYITAIEQLDFQALPNSFAAKATHGCGWNLFVKDKKTINQESFYASLRTWLASDYLSGAEVQYRRIPHGVTFEELLSDARGESPIDFKIWVLAGKVRWIQVVQDRFVDRKHNNYDPAWNLLDVVWRSPTFTFGPGWPKPENLTEMIWLAERLAEPFPIVRIDVYNHNGRLYLSEITHTSYAGLNRFLPEDFNRVAADLLLGRISDIPDHYRIPSPAHSRLLKWKDSALILPPQPNRADLLTPGRETRPRRRHTCR